MRKRLKIVTRLTLRRRKMMRMMWRICPWQTGKDQGEVEAFALENQGGDD
jgi:hypothetical protein